MIADGISQKEAIESLNVEQISGEYVKRSVELNITSDYKTTLGFYLEIGSEDEYYIARIVNANINNLEKKFNGNVFYHLEDMTRIYFLVDGTFFDNGNTNRNLESDLENSRSINFLVTDDSGKYEEVYISGYLHCTN